MAEFYKQSEHGPFKQVPLDRRYCMLQGAYVLCPALEYGERSRCTAFEGEMLIGKNSLLGLMGNKRPVLTPLRLDACIENRCTISLLLTRHEPETKADLPEE